MNIYETAKLREEYLLFHYGTPEQICSWPGGPREALGFLPGSWSDFPVVKSRAPSTSVVPWGDRPSSCHGPRLKLWR